MICWSSSLVLPRSCSMQVGHKSVFFPTPPLLLDLRKPGRPWMMYWPQPMQAPSALSTGARRIVVPTPRCCSSTAMSRTFCRKLQQPLLSRKSDSRSRLLPTAWKSTIRARSPKDRSKAAHWVVPIHLWVPAIFQLKCCAPWVSKPFAHAISSHCCNAEMSGTKHAPPKSASLFSSSSSRKCELIIWMLRHPHPQPRSSSNLLSKCST